MAAFVDSTVKDIDGRLRDLADDMSKLKAARAVLAADGSVRRQAERRAPRSQRRRPAATATATSTRRSPSRRSAARRRGRSATRATKTVEIVRTQPGITIPALAKTMNISPNYLYRVMPRLAADGQVRRDGKGWRIAS